MGCNVSSTGSQIQSSRGSRTGDAEVNMQLLPNGARMPSVGYGTWMVNNYLFIYLFILMGCNASSTGNQIQSSRGSHTGDAEVNMQILPNGARLPSVGLGTWMAQDEELERALDAAFEAGYRHIDTAAAYQNEKTIGKVLKRWFDGGKLKREDLFITTKLPPAGNRPSDVEKFLNKSLEDLQLDYVDLYLVHTPFSFKSGDDLHPVDENGFVLLDNTTDHVAIWKEMEKQLDSGKTKAIGVSNFNEKQLKRVLDNARIPPANLQIEIHLYLQQNDLVKFCKEHNITVTAYSPLGSPGLTEKIKVGDKSPLPSILKHPDVIELGKKHNKSPAQIALKFLLQRGIAVIPKSVNPGRIKENIDIFDFKLTEEEMKQLQKLDRGEEGRIVTFDFFKGLKENHPEYPFK